MMPFEFLVPILLYAETHYSFKGIYSRLKKREPEIIADAPHRIEPNQSIPIMLLIKDSHLFPIKLKNVEVNMVKANQLVLKKSFSLNTDYIQKKYHFIILEIDPPANIAGLVKIDVKFEIIIENNVRIYHNDNYRISSHDPLAVYLAEQPLPRTKNWYFGDIHCHTAYTEDQAEFGAPLAPSIRLSQAMGLSFFAATDHSYDLDDAEINYLKNDHQLKKWQQFRQEVDSLNEKYADFVILPGEEVSAGNVDNRNVHLLILNNRKFIPGSGDSAERWFRTAPDLSIPDILDQIDEAALAIAAHPEVTPPLLQWLLIRRGKWKPQDYLHARLNGLQIWNGLNDAAFQKGIQSWVKLLLHGRKVFIYAGNDAHGNFNRFRQIGFPFWTFRESNDQIFGKMRTVIRIESALSQENIFHAIKQGRCMITNGPFVDFEMSNENGMTAKIGDQIVGNSLMLKISARSTFEFGELYELKTFYGNLKTKNETLFQKLDQFDNPYIFNFQREFSLHDRPAYVRLELISATGLQCLTNPIWLV